MARTRNIKPEFFKHEGLAEIEPLGRLLFAGLWLLADREGRLEDRPKRIKTDTLPYDDCDVDNLLQKLAEKGFIIRYEVKGKRFIEIPTFKKHQHIVGTEKPSEIPGPQGVDNSFSNEFEKKSNNVEKKSNELEEMAPESLILNPIYTTTTTRARAREEKPVDNNDDEWAQVTTTFNNNIHPISGQIELDRLHDLYKDFGAVWVIAAIEEAVTSSKGPPSLSYLTAILERWRREGFKSKREEQSNGRKSGGRSGANQRKGGVSEEFKRQCREADARQVYPWDVPAPGSGD